MSSAYKLLSLSFVIACIIAGTVNLAACERSKADAAKASAVAPTQVAELIQKNQAVVYDLREADERSEIIDNVQWMPMSKLADESEWKNFVTHLPKGKEIIFHCAAGYRSKRIAEKLAAQGIRASYFDGPRQWKAADLPLNDQKRQ